MVEGVDAGIQWYVMVEGVDVGFQWYDMVEETTVPGGAQTEITDTPRNSGNITELNSIYHFFDRPTIFGFW